MFCLDDIPIWTVHTHFHLGQTSFTDISLSVRFVYRFHIIWTCFAEKCQYLDYSYTYFTKSGPIMYREDLVLSHFCTDLSQSRTLYRCAPFFTILYILTLLYLSNDETPSSPFLQIFHPIGTCFAHILVYP